MIRRIFAIFIKELQDMKTNWNQLFMYILPIGMTLVYAKLIPEDQIPKGMALSLGLLMLVIIAGVFIPAMMIAEEKEKRTLDALFLSPARPVEVFLGKSIVTLISIFICTFILLYIDNKNWSSIGLIVSATLLISLFCILFGIIVGIFSKNQMATGITGTPIMFIFLMPPMFAVMGMNQIETVAKVIPTYYFLNLLKKTTFDGISTQDIIYNLSVIAGSIVVGLVILFFTYKYKGLET